MLPGVTITGASGGTASEYFAIVNTTSSIILGFDLSGGTIPPGSGILTQVTFTDFVGESICFGTDPIGNVISDAIGGSVSTEWGDCVCLVDYDECGVCGGDNYYTIFGLFPNGNCDCNSICSDGSECTNNQCADESDCTSHIEDDCGVCGGDDSFCADCTDIPNGDAYIDNCSECVGGTTDLVECDADCSTTEEECVSPGVWEGEYCWGGSLVNDECGECDGPGLGAGSYYMDCWDWDEYCSNSDCPIDPSQVSYKIYRNGLGIAITEVQGITEYTDEDLDFNEQYCYTVTYVNGEFESHHSNQACAITDVEVLGCTDANACNYNAEANSDDGDCIYPSGCDNLCGSTAVNDECGVCDGECDYSNDNIPCNGDWEGYGPTCPTADCEGVPGGETLVDGCGVCGGTNDCYYYFVEGVYAHSSNNDGEIIESTNNGEELFETDFYFSELDSIVFTAAINGEPFEVWNGNYHYNILDSTFCIDWDLNRGSRSSSNIFSNNRGTEECWHADVVYDTLLTTNISYAVITTPDGIVTIEPAVQGCLYSDACNYNADANTQLGNLSICWENDECDICGGTGIPDEECDCNSTLGADTNEDGDPDDFTPHYLDECGVCDADESNNCIQDCYGTWGGSLENDECGVCGGPGFIYQCGCEDIPEGDCDCFGNVLDECGVCGGDGPEGSCDCEGNIPEGDCDCFDNIIDACGVCDG